MLHTCHRFVAFLAVAVAVCGERETVPCRDDTCDAAVVATAQRTLLQTSAAFGYAVAASSGEDGGLGLAFRSGRPGLTEHRGGTEAATLLPAALTTTASEMRGDHQSIFSIPYSDMAPRTFWLMCSILFLCTYTIDKGTGIIVEKTRNHHCNKAFVDRAIAEIMIFGVVAMVLFVAQQAMTMDMTIFNLLEFADIMVSFGACFLILAGIILVQLRTHLDYVLDWLYTLKPERVAASLEEATSLSDVPMKFWMRVQLEVVRSEFLEFHSKLNEKTFSFSTFLVESMNEGICQLIQISRTTWCTLLAFSTVALLVKMGLNVTTVDSPYVYALKLALLTWFVLVLLGCLLIKATRLMREMQHILGLANLEELRKSSRKAFTRTVPQDSGKPICRPRITERAVHKMRWWGDWIAQCTQVLAVSMSLLVGFYLMNIIYNVVTYRMGWYWHVIFITPFLLCYLLVLPALVVVWTFLRLFGEVDPNVMDSVIEDVSQAWLDLQFVERQLRAKAIGEGSDSISARSWACHKMEDANKETDGQLTLEEFKMVLTHMGIHVSIVRAHRLFYLVADMRDSITYEEFLDHVFYTRGKSPSDSIDVQDVPGPSLSTKVLRKRRRSLAPPMVEDALAGLPMGASASMILEVMPPTPQAG